MNKFYNVENFKDSFINKENVDKKLDELDKQLQHAESQLDAQQILTAFFYMNAEDINIDIEAIKPTEPRVEVVTSYKTKKIAENIVKYTLFGSLLVMFYNVWLWLGVIAAFIALLYFNPAIVSFVFGLFFMMMLFETLFTQGKGYEHSTREV